MQAKEERGRKNMGMEHASNYLSRQRGKKKTVTTIQRVCISPATLLAIFTPQPLTLLACLTNGLNGRKTS